MRKLRRPYFIETTLLPDGRVEMIDTEGDVYRVQMDRRVAWPILSRRARRFELMERAERREKASADPKPPTHPGGRPKLKLVG